MKRLFMLIIGILLSYNANALSLEKVNELSRFSVKIELFKNGEILGSGTGVAINTDGKYIYVLTNRHVCKPHKKSNLIMRFLGYRMVAKFAYMSGQHDLCLISFTTTKRKPSLSWAITVTKKLKYPTVADSFNMKKFNKLTVIGFPFGGKKTVSEGYNRINYETISLMKHMERCPIPQNKDQFDILDNISTKRVRVGNVEFLDLCKIPNIRRKVILEYYDSMPISNLIAAGSSGSPVFNENGEIVGLIFAGIEGYSLGWAVPIEQIQLFLKTHKRQIKIYYNRFYKGPITDPLDLHSIKKLSKKCKLVSKSFCKAVKTTIDSRSF